MTWLIRAVESALAASATAQLDDARGPLAELHRALGVARKVGGVLRAKDRYQFPRRPPARGAEVEEHLSEPRRGRLRAEPREVEPEVVGQRSDQRGDVRRRPVSTCLEPLCIRAEPLRIRPRPLRILGQEPLRVRSQPLRIDRGLRLRPELVVAVRPGRVQGDQLSVSQPAQERARPKRVEPRDGGEASVVEAGCTVGFE